MDRHMLARMKQDTPKVNPEIGHGLAVRDMLGLQKYYDRVLRSVARGFPQGFEYIDMVRATPEQKIEAERSKKGDRITYDIAESNLEMYYMRFRLHGKEMAPRPIYLPFLENPDNAGAIMLGGSRFFFSPVLTDIVLSYEHDNIFVRLVRDKFTLRRLPHMVNIDGRLETIQNVWSLIWHMKDRNKRVNSPKTLLVHYLLCRYGFREMFRRFGGTIPAVGLSDINRANYPEDQWVICASSQHRPEGMSFKNMRQPSEVRLAIPRHEFTPMVRSLVSGFFYVVDYFPHRFLEPKYSHLDNTWTWKVLLGLILFGDEKGEGMIHDEIDDHIRSLDEYMDVTIMEKFQEIGINSENIYEFFAVAIEKFNDWILQAPDKTNSLYDKELSVVPEILMGLTSSFVTFHFKLRTAAKKGLTETEVKNLMMMYLKPKGIFGLTKQPPGVSNMSYSGDNKLFKITTTVFPQKNRGGGDGRTISDRSRFLHVSHAVVGSYNALSKSNLIGDQRINPHIKLDGSKIIQETAQAPLLDLIQQQIKRT